MQRKKNNATVGLTGATVAKVVPVQPARGESKVESDRVGNIVAKIVNIITCDKSAKQLLTVVKVNIITYDGSTQQK